MSIYRQGPSPAGSCPRCQETLVDVPDMNGVRASDAGAGRALTCPECLVPMQKIRIESAAVFASWAIVYDRATWPCI